MFKPPGYGLYNTAIVVLKFLLIPLAICVLVFDQLEIRFPAQFALVDATPLMQASRDREFHIAFYALRVFARYSRLRVEATLLEPGGQASRLAPQSSERRTPPFYSYDFSLPPTGTSGEYQVQYAVYFDDQPEVNAFRAAGGRTHRIDYTPECVDKLNEPYWISVRQGQQTRLPKEWEAMHLEPAGGAQAGAVRTRGGVPWVTVSATPGEYQIHLRSGWTISGIDASRNRIEMRGDGTRALSYDAQTHRLNRCGARLEPAVGDRLAFLPKPDGVARMILTTPAASPDNTWDIEVHATVVPNLPPTSAYFQDPTNTVTLFTSWLFTDLNQRRKYFRLSRYVMDPDGQDPATGEPDIRVRHVSLPAQGDSALYELVTQPGPEYLLYLTRAGEQVFGALPMGRSRDVLLEASDEMRRPPITLKVFRDR